MFTKLLVWQHWCYCIQCYQKRLQSKAEPTQQIVKKPELNQIRIYANYDGVETKVSKNSLKKSSAWKNERVPLQKWISTNCEPHSTVCTRVVHTGGKSTKNMPRRYLRSETNHHRVSRCSTIQFLVVFTRFSCWYCTKCTFQNQKWIN